MLWRVFVVANGDPGAHLYGNNGDDSGEKEIDSQERVLPCVQALSEFISSSQSCFPLIFLPPEPQIMPPTMASHLGEDFP